MTVTMTARQALDTLNFYGADARLPPPYDKLSHSEITALAREEDLPAQEERERIASEQRIANAPNALRRVLQEPPKRPTPKLPPSRVWPSPMAPCTPCKPPSRSAMACNAVSVPQAWC